MDMREKKDHGDSQKEDAPWYRYSQSALINSLGNDTMYLGFI